LPLLHREAKAANGRARGELRDQLQTGSA
jgi:hypothetical protein